MIRINRDLLASEPTNLDLRLPENMTLEDLRKVLDSLNLQRDKFYGDQGFLFSKEIRDTPLLIDFHPSTIATFDGKKDP